MTHLDLFSGIGGFALAAKWSGVKTIGLSEIDPFCCKLLAKRFPTIKNYGDITKTDFSELTGRISILTGGFPCQPFSVAGQRKGKDDDRHLWPSMFSTIKLIRPHWLILENVVGIIDMELVNCFIDLEEAGYQPQTFIIPACAVNAPHRRDRVWIIAHPDGNNGHAIKDEKSRQSKAYVNSSFKVTSNSHSKGLEGQAMARKQTLPV